MPRGFSESEQELIRERLEQEGEKLFAAKGIRHTTVADLAGAAGIAKGSFYRFAPSKEELFFDILEKAEAEIRSELEKELREAGEDVEVRLWVAGERAVGVLTERPLFRIFLDPRELRALERGVPPERLRAHLSGDEGFFEKLFGSLLSRPSDAAVGAGLLKVLVFLPTLEAFIGRDVLPEVAQRLVDYIASGLAQEAEAQ